MSQDEISQRSNYINCLYISVQLVDLQVRKADKAVDLISLKEHLIDLTSEIIIQKKIINADYQNDQATIERLLSVD